MANYANLLATIAANIYQNGNSEVSATMVKAAVDQMVASLGAGYQFMGVATPVTNPGTPDEKVFYIASEPGTYTNFVDSGSDPIVVNDGEVVILKYETAWSKEVADVDYILGEEDSPADLSFKDQNGNTIAMFIDGGIRTKKFNSDDIDEIKIETSPTSDFIISDKSGNILLSLSGGGIKTKNFDSNNRYKSFSIVGDSYSAYNGDVIPLTNTPYYPANDIDDSSQMWYRLFEKSYNARLLINNSYSGSPICYDGYGTGTADAKSYSFVTRCRNIGEPDIILIFGGANDIWAGAAVGNYIYSNWTESDLCTFAPALAYMFDYLKRRHPLSKIIFIKNDVFNEAYSDAIDVVCSHYNVPTVLLSSIDKTSNHPTKLGMQQISEQLLRKIVTL
jgi:hypothetical protein